MRYINRPIVFFRFIANRLPSPTCDLDITFSYSKYLSLPDTLQPIFHTYQPNLGYHHISLHNYSYHFYFLYFILQVYLWRVHLQIPYLSPSLFLTDESTACVRAYTLDLFYVRFSGIVPASTFYGQK